MAKTKTPGVPTIVGVVLLGYHLLAVAKDAEQAAANWQRFNANPSVNTFLRLLLAEGVLVEDLGLEE